MKTCSDLLRILFLILCSFYGFSLHGTEIKRIDGISHPISLQINENKIVIVDSHDLAIKVYDKNDLTNPVIIGAKGEGPGEYTTVPFITLMSDEIFVSAQKKNLSFSYDGKLLRENVNKTNLKDIVPLGTSFMGWRLSFDKGNILVEYYLQAEDMEPQKLHSGPSMINKDRTMNLFEVFFIGVCCDCFVFADRQESAVMIYNSKGEFIQKIEVEKKNVPFTQENRRNVESYFLQSTRYKDSAERLNKMRRYPTTFPEIMTLKVDGSKIYIISYKTIDNQFDSIVYNLETNKKTNLRIPLKYTVPVSYLISPFCIYNDQLYQLVENEKTDEWELWVSPLATSD